VYVFMRRMVIGIDRPWSLVLGRWLLAISHEES
jgi:hypothetical protein